MNPKYTFILIGIMTAVLLLATGAAVAQNAIVADSQETEEPERPPDREGLSEMTIEDLFLESKQGMIDLAAAEQERTNTRARIRYDRYMIPNWKKNFWGNGTLVVIPMPANEVACEAIMTQWGWGMACTPTGNLVADYYVPSEQDRAKMTNKQLALLGLNRPPPPPAGVCLVGKPLWTKPAGCTRFSPEPGDTCLAGAEVEFGGETAIKVCYATPFGDACWYETGS